MYLLCTLVLPQRAFPRGFQQSKWICCHQTHPFDLLERKSTQCWEIHVTNSKEYSLKSLRNTNDNIWEIHLTIPEKYIWHKVACLYPAQSDPEITQPLTMKTIFTTTGQIEGTTQHMHTYTHTYMYTKYTYVYNVHCTYTKCIHIQNSCYHQGRTDWRCYTQHIHLWMQFK